MPRPRFRPLVVLFCAFVSSRATAEESERFEAARQHFEAGVDDLDRGRAAEAIERFEASLAIRHSLPTLYNLGLAFRAAGRQRDALATFERFLDESTKQGELAGVAHARVLAESLRGSLCRVTLQVRGDARDVRLDGAPLDVARGDHGLVLDAGRHVFTANDGDLETVATLAPGSQTIVVLDATPPPPPLVTEPPPPVPIIAAPAVEPTNHTVGWIALSIAVVATVAGVIAISRSVGGDDEGNLDGGSRGIVLRGLEIR